MREAKGISDALIEAYIISDNDEELRILAMDSSNIELQVEAIEALGIVGAEDACGIEEELWADDAVCGVEGGRLDEEPEDRCVELDEARDRHVGPVLRVEVQVIDVDVLSERRGCRRIAG